MVCVVVPDAPLPPPGVPQPFLPPPLQQHSIMGQPYIELRHRAPEPRPSLSFSLPETPLLSPSDPRPLVRPGPKARPGEPAPALDRSSSFSSSSSLRLLTHSLTRCSSPPLGSDVTTNWSTEIIIFYQGGESTNSTNWNLSGEEEEEERKRRRKRGRGGGADF